MNTFLKTVFSFLIIGLLSCPAIAQNNSDFQLATRLMQQQQYADALPLLQNLHEDNPETYVYADRLIDCLIQLKQYDQGLEIAHNYQNQPKVESQVQIRIGEIYHFKEQTETALDIWYANLESNPRQLQLYITTARTMVSRREYLEAVEVYKKARNEFQNQRLFFGDIANAYMRAGEYELAIEEWLNLLEASPNQISYIQRSLLRYNDPILYDITIIELDERLSNLSISSPNYQTFYQLQIWLLQENKLYRRALATAKEYESRSESYNYSLFNLGRQLTENNEFELAKEAFTYYTDNAYGEIKWRGLEELGDTYSKWAKYIDDYNLDFTNKRDSLYKLATVMLDSIETQTNNYSGMGNVQLKRAELALDHVFDLGKATTALRKLRNLPAMRDSPEIPYLEGRIHLAQKEFTEARINFTRSNKQAEIGELAEKTRYFLALTDFYAGDYEFAGIQLKSLGRQNTSYYANDALELRLWLQQGTAADTSGEMLSRFADAVFMENNGKSSESAEEFLAMINDESFTALKDDALLFFVESPHIQKAVKYNELSLFLTSNPATPIKEKLLWEQAKLAEQTNIQSVRNVCESAGDCFWNSDSTTSTAQISPKDIYEKLILEYPQGFYAPYARERLTDLTNQNS
ncbi:tetratricopeptide repeat protein [Gracilimonas sp. BCB1]|uniref:tetratricopeptide repeat protein n=1 Tax=Gracilimonas sp. BCB1 TaxID=3152362 RepID=UPI0032D8F630